MTAAPRMARMSENVALQALCETGQAQLMAMEYLQAEATLAEAERATIRVRLPNLPPSRSREGPGEGL